MRDDISLPLVYNASGADSDFLSRLKKRAAKNFKWTREQSLQDSTYLAYWLAFFGQEDDALALCDFLVQVEFSGNYRHWSWIEGCLALGARLRRRQGDTEGAGDYVDRIRNQQFVADRLKGVLLQNYNRAVNSAIELASKSDERDARILVAKELCVMIELGGSSEKARDEIEAQFRENQARLMTLVDAPRGSTR